MQAFKATPKRWGNSLGVTIPNEIVKREKFSSQKEVTVFVLGNQMETVRKTFGTLKITKPTQEIMDEIDEGYD